MLYHISLSLRFNGPFCSWTWVGRYQNDSVLCTSCSSSCYHSPPPSPLAPIKSRMESFWYRLTQAGTRMTSFWILAGANGDGGGGNNWSYKTCKAPVKLSPPTNQHPVFLQTLPVAQPIVSKNMKGKLFSVFNFLTYINVYSHLLTYLLT